MILTSSLLSKTDVIWIRDFISIVETLYDEECEPLSVVETRAFDDDLDHDETDPNIVPVRFDYVWVIKNKNGIRKYRIILREGERDLTVYPMNLELLKE